MAKYKVTYELDEEGWWVASAANVRGCHSQGRSIGQVRGRLRQALGLFVNDANDATFVEEIKIPNTARATVSKAIAARNKLEQEEAKAKLLVSRAAKSLVTDLNLSYRDAAEILGLSHQRIQQLLN